MRIGPVLRQSITTSRNLNMTGSLKDVKRIIPPLGPEMHKGQAGRIGVVGGSKESA